jgi:hypothetical protein
MQLAAFALNVSSTSPNHAALRDCCESSTVTVGTAVGTHSHSLSCSTSVTVGNAPAAGDETRPKNAYVNYIIKY